MVDAVRSALLRAGSRSSFEALTERRFDTKASFCEGLSVRHAGICGIVGIRDGCAGNDHHVVEVRAEPALRSGAGRRLDRRLGSATDVVGANPEQKTDDGTTLDADALICTGCSGHARLPVVERQLTFERLMGGSHASAVAVFGEQVDADAPES
jgi:hypothetical protein